MKIVGIAGSNAEFSYNHLLLNFLKKHFDSLVDIEILDIKDVPMFNQSDDQTNSEPIQYLNKKITEADGVIIATPRSEERRVGKECRYRWSRETEKEKRRSERQGMAKEERQ